MSPFDRRRAPTTLALLFSCLVSIPPTTGGSSAQEKDMTERFVVLEHASGELALPVSAIDTAWRRDATADAPSSLRLVSRALGEPKVLTGEAADSLWQALSMGPWADRFLLVSHQGGTLAVPIAQIRSAFYSTENGPRLRLVYEGDPSGKVVEGEEAELTWKRLTD